MSWAEEDWTVGLSGRVLQKVKELQVHHERLSRENKQKQLQLDNIHTSLEKQTVKYEEVRGELLSVQRELQRVQDEAKAAVSGRERLSQELHTKQAQVCSFEGQLDAARTLNNKLTQEVKRLEAELEKLQSSSLSADTTLFSTPCWNSTSPWEHNGSRKEERTGHRDEGQRQIRQRLQFSEAATASLPRQQHRSTPLRHPSDQSDAFSSPSAAFPWEREESRPAGRRRSPVSPQTPSADVRAPGQAEPGVRTRDPGAEADACASALRSRVSALEEELQAKAATLRSVQSEVAQSKKELSAKELSIQRGRDELSMAHTRMAQESERASAAEQRLKQVQEELKCQRQNAESSRLQHQQRSKELEKQHQRDLTELQKERQSLEKQQQQEVNKLNQELQQARTLHNALQAQADKLSLQKQTLDKELEALKQKLKWTEGQLQESQKKEAQTQLKLTEAVRQAEGVAASLEQSRKRERALEEEGRRLAEERADALRLLRELQEQKAAPAPEAVQFVAPQRSYSPQSRPSAHIKKSPSVAHAEHRRDEELNKRRADTSYPSDREPGEGIDSEHITVLNSPKCEAAHRQRRCRASNEEQRVTEAITGDASEPSKRTTAEPALPRSSHCAAEPPSSASVGGDDARPEQGSADLSRENASLRSELRDLRDELQKRLDDLEAQRRAETEARTRLKQLSRKHSSQCVEKQEQEKEWRAQLEAEKAEAERLRKAMAALETELKRRKEERERSTREEEEDEESKKRALEDRESEMMELNMQLKKQLSEVKAQLALEREERQREEQQRSQVASTDQDLRKELSLKLEELQAELDELKLSRRDDSLEEEKLSAANSPLTYLTLTDDELGSRLPSPEQHLLFCQATNQRNVLQSQQSHTQLIQEEPELNHLLGSELLKGEPASSDLTRELQRLQEEKAREAQRANSSQQKLEALQNQVTRQTQQLTMAFEKQTQHISGLLVELQEKESAFLSQAEELQRCKLELDALKAQREEQQQQKEEERTCGVGEDRAPSEEVEMSGPQTTQEREADVWSPAPHPAAYSDSEAATSCSGEENPPRTEAAVLVDGGAGARGAPDVAELNQLLDQRRSDTCPAGSQPHSTDQDSAELHQTTARDSEQPQLQEGGGAEPREASMKAEEEEEEEEEEAAYELQLQQLQQQVVELQTRVRSLSEETQQQASELAVWRLASQPAPTYQQPQTQEGDQAQTQTQVQSVPRYDEEQPATVTVVREDEILLSSSTDRLQGRMLFSRLQHHNLPEPKTPPPPRKTPALLCDEHTDMDSEKENQEINLLHQANTCPAPPKEKLSDIIQVSPERTGQQHVGHLPGLKQSRAGQSDGGRAESPAEASRTTTVSRDDRPHMISVASQTEQSSCPPTVPQLLCAYTQTEEEEEEEEEEEVESPSLSPAPVCEGAAPEDRMLFSGSFPIPADPVRLAERIRRNRTQLSAAFDDTEYEPYGLPEVVMKGFADIPTGPSCPYIVRRGLLGTAVVPGPQKPPDQEEETD